jgi:hypothetical protein
MQKEELINSVILHFNTDLNEKSIQITQYES